MCDVLKSDGDVAIAGIAGIGLIASGYYSNKRSYRADVKNGKKSITFALAQNKSELVVASNEQSATTGRAEYPATHRGIVA